MKKLAMYRYLLIFALFTLSHFTIWACNVDVTILEGNAITACRNEPNALNASASFVQYTWSGAASGNTASARPIADGWAVVTATDNTGCISKDSILVSLIPSTNPTILSSEGNDICPPINGTTLSLDQTYDEITWSDGSTDPTLFVQTSGIYYALVLDANGCYDSTALDLTFLNFTANTLGSNTVCSGSSLILEATGGSTYAWSTGEFTPTITVAPTQSTNYNVTIYEGGCFQTLTVTVNVGQLSEHTMPDTVLVMPGTIGYVNGPSNFDVFQWMPTEYVTSTSGAVTGYNHNESGPISLIATNNSIGCSMTHTVYFKYIELTIPQGFSPNNDGINDFFEIPEIHGFNASLKVWNRWGDLVYESSKYANDWDGKCTSALCFGDSTLPEGTYFYILTIDGNKFDSYVTIKL